VFAHLLEARVMSDATARLVEVRLAIARAEADAFRPVGSVTLVAVAKTFAAIDVEPVLLAGQRIFGENRVQEAQGKWPELKARHPDIELHLIGPLQTNKARDAVALFDVIHTVDRPAIAQALAKEISRQGKTPVLLVQVNTGEEERKAGVSPREADAFIADCQGQYGLTIEGLMCIPPVEQSPGPHFALLAKIAARNGLTRLSMGMSSDFDTAIEAGATYVRVGSAIFGTR
jgi:PLP dependent protein